jgi:uncharacterized protein YjiS (DUF1127 family)
VSVSIQHLMTNCLPGRPGSGGLGVALARSLADTLRLWRSRARERHSFPALDDRELRDLRLSRWQVERELAKPFWRG